MGLETFQLKTLNQEENALLTFTSKKGNAVTKNEQYFHALYTIELTFEDGQYTFTPVNVHLKLNSKYDMGWKEVDLNDGTMYFKKGKPIRKLKDYTDGLTEPINALNDSLKAYLNGE